ncbi:MAG TPA: cell division topological specificity factor MinE [Firmicutes bacterium]|jgi:cell division topological specificity factor|nr:cell division topological specificity factor MinE [Bacillota bacterium]
MFDLRRLWGGKRGSKTQAKERLQLILIHDRSSLSPELLDLIKQRILDVLTEFVEIDEQGLAIDLEQTDDTSALITNIPIKAVRRNTRVL